MQLNINDFESCKRIVVKIGSALLTDDASGEVRHKWLEALASDLATLKKRGQDVIIVSSGSISLGRGALGFKHRPSRLEDAQAAAAIGQVRLAHAYETVFRAHNITTAQVLLTLDDLEDRPRYLNARNTIESLLAHGVIPVINENDTVATTEIRFGDNDRLAARVGQISKANAVLLLSDIDGLYTADPRTDETAEFIPLVDDITPEIEAMAGPVTGAVGSGGMVTKIMAAKIATSTGAALVILNGTEIHPIKAFSDSGHGTVFSAAEDSLAIRKQWIRGLMAPKGRLVLDEGAVKALRNNASLLAAGVVTIEGDFSQGDLISFTAPNEHIIGQGLISFSSEEAHKIRGKKMNDVAEILGYSGRSALIHRDDLVLF